MAAVGRLLLINCGNELVFSRHTVLGFDAVCSGRDGDLAAASKY